MDLTDARSQRLRQVVDHRQQDLTVILENVHDPHNIGAVLRTCDSVGIAEIFILYTEDRLSEENNIEPGKTSSSGADKWIDVHYFRDIESCFTAVKKKYDKIYATALGESSSSLYDLNLTESVALLFGNEADGLSTESLAYADSNYLIPQVGFVKSLNISVACAVSVYEALRQRQVEGKVIANPTWHDALAAKYKQIHFDTKLEKREWRQRKKALKKE